MSHNCLNFPACGGCLYRDLSPEQYCNQKKERFSNILKAINQSEIVQSDPIFIADATRRRATFTFSYHKKQLKFGFNAAQSHDIVDIKKCLLLTPRLNNNLCYIRKLITELCQEPFTVKQGKKLLKQSLTAGDVSLCDAENGIDILFDIPYAPELNHRLLISEQINSCSDIIRVSWRTKSSEQPETILEKSRPYIINSGINVYISAGTFLQASVAGEQALINQVMKYIGTENGMIADLFCGIGTFSYPLSKDKNNKILAIDSSVELLQGFQTSVNRNQITNIQIKTRNLFKYPLDEQEIANCDIMIFDPPRAGAAAQVKQVATASQQPPVVIAVSCNPHTFVNDANTLISGGYTIKDITMVDQFVYSGHTELVALFKKE
ncbi:MAG: class I SAM-dependent RNA methyltransferase [Alphaproteobacteria bacterium]|nr:class I SAM-dependent RNA methyltransferase [Alphaproteobacteria bacterium]